MANGKISKHNYRPKDYRQITLQWASEAYGCSKFRVFVTEVEWNSYLNRTRS